MNRVEPAFDISSEVAIRDCVKEEVLSNVSRYHSENLNNMESLGQSRPQRLYHLLVRFRLEELGFRKNEYEHLLERIDNEKLTMTKVYEHVAQICSMILQRRQNPVRPLQLRRLPMIRKSSEVLRPQQKECLFVCGICCQETFTSTLGPLMPCGHSFCDSCIRNTIQQSINEAKYTMGCMEMHCKEAIPDELIRKALEPERYQRYQYFKKKKELESDPNNHFCTKPNCQGLLKQEDGLYVCPACYSKYCRTCLQLEHAGNCEGKLEQAIETVYDKYKIKKCPKCKSPIQKSDGCNHMTCKKCGFQFCWICLGKYSKYHYRYYNCCGCPGMQFEDERDICKQRCKQFLFFTVVPVAILAILCVAIICLPVYMFFMMLYKPYVLASANSPGCCCQDCEDCCDCCSNLNCCCLSLYFVYLPLGILYGIFYAPIKYTGMLFSQLGDIVD